MMIGACNFSEFSPLLKDGYNPLLKGSNQPRIPFIIHIDSQGTLQTEQDSIPILLPHKVPQPLSCIFY
ncbi:unnamed protein product [Tuber melanosporum]|uniref:(Perigord truffle) hypothetical protein n=1 Tax=Tuber melanosporum (strain Mel28) TaxID=656061 RepID=D5GJI0_TUBMM|nr:uncharacterized protein GSTUM_00009026001 [Tuber melanosporum]CAZ84673.1 unnamed protein product [Tuber melanosporum]